MSRPAAAASITQDAYERLRADILACRIRPGARLRINELCLTLGISLSAVREALARLTSDELVIAEPQRGFRAAPISADDLQDLTQIRVDIEGKCLERSIRAGSIEWESAVVASLHRLSRTPEREPADPSRMCEAWSAAHHEFHEALVSACDSPWLLRLRRTLYAQSERYRRLSVPLAENVRAIAAEHHAIMSAALARDGAAATALMARHLELTTEILLQQSWLDALPARPAVKA